MLPSLLTCAVCCVAGKKPLVREVQHEFSSEMWISAHWECPSTGIPSVRQRKSWNEGDASLRAP